MNELSNLIARHCPQEMTNTAIPQLILTRADAPTVLRGAVFHPLLCVVVRGRKRVQLGSEIFEYDPSTYLLASAELPVTGQVIEREIYYRLLLGKRGTMLRQLAMPASQLSQVNRAISRIRSHFHETLRIEELAVLAGMSAPTFHRHFRAITNLSPLQFQKRLRLQEARTLLLSRQGNAASIAFEVGYESPSQFSRDYRRLFGSPPARDAAEAQRAL